jgi:hypothetical protein
MSPAVASGISAVASRFAFQSGLESIASCGASSRTLRNRTSAPAFSACCAITRASSAIVPVDE